MEIKLNRICACILLFAALMFGAAQHVQAQYCLPVYSNACSSGDFIDNMVFNTINNSSTGCNGVAPNNNIDYTSTISTVVARGASYQISLSPGPQWEQHMAVYIDWNQDQDYQDPGEYYYIGDAPAGSTISGTITVPLTATLGTTRMRVLCRYSAGNPAPLQTDACGSFSFGEVEEYGLQVIPPPPIDISSVGLESPVTGCDLDTAEIVTGIFRNQGLNDTSGITYCYQYGSGAPVCETDTSVLQSGDTLFYTFATTVNLTGAGLDSISIWATIGNDQVSSNDTLADITFFNYGQTPIVPSNYFEGFESGAAGWTTYGDTSSWQLGAPANLAISSAAEGTQAWVTNLTGLYNPNELSYLQSPCFDFSGASVDPILFYSQNFSIDQFDNHYVEYSLDAGVTWARLGSDSTGFNWYNDQFDQSWNLATTPLGSWRDAYHKLDGVSGSENVFIRYAFEETGFTLDEGAGVDAVQILDTIRNVGAISIVSPTSGCLLGANETVTVLIENRSNITESNFPVCFTVDGGAPTCETFTGTIDADSTESYTFTGLADLTGFGDHDIVIYTQLPGDISSENDTTTITVTNFPVISTLPYFESFETGTASWAIGGENPSWEWGAPAKAVISGAATGSNAWVTGTLGFLTYNPNEDSYVEGPCFDLQGQNDLWVGSQVWWNSEFSWDGARLEYSLDTGQTWLQVGEPGDPYNWYTDSSLNGFPFPDQDGWTGRISTQNGSNGYVQAKHPVDFPTNTGWVKFRIRFASDPSVQDDGFAFDNFAIGVPVQVDLGSDSVVCDSLVLTPSAPSNGSFQWDSLTSGFAIPFDSSQTVTITSSGTYILTYTDSLGFCDSDTIEVTVNNTPVVDLGSDQNICMNDSISLTVDPATYPMVMWSTGSSNSSIDVSTSGTFYVDVVDSVGCPSSDTIVTNMVPLPTFSLGPDFEVCQGDTFCISTGVSGPGYTYIWSTGATTDTICASIISGYFAQVTDSNGCIFRDSVIVTSAAPAPTSMATFDTTNCPMIDFTDLSTGQVNNYFWDFGDGNSSTMANPSYSYAASGNGTYQVLFVVSNTCGTDTTALSVDINCLVGIENGPETFVKVFPNPSNGAFRLEAQLDGAVPVEVEISDVTGKRVYFRDLGERSGIFALPLDLDIGAGVYIVRLKAGDRTATERLVIE